MPAGEEIERKYLVYRSIDELIASAGEDYVGPMLVEQRYLGQTGDWVIRLRRCFDEDGHAFQHFLTLKNKINDLRCVELEEEVSAAFYAVAAEHCGPIVSKMRHRFVFDKEWSVDVFHNPELADIVLAEIELESEDAAFDRPEWLGPEVTNDPNYRNFALAQRCTVSQ